MNRVIVLAEDIECLSVSLCADNECMTCPALHALFAGSLWNLLMVSEETSLLHSSFHRYTFGGISLLGHIIIVCASALAESW